MARKEWSWRVSKLHGDSGGLSLKVINNASRCLTLLIILQCTQLGRKSSGGSINKKKAKIQSWD